jgi:hypothetical protein
MAQILIPPEIWEKILSNVGGTETCKECGKEYCTNCLDDNNKLHVICKVCRNILCKKIEKGFERCLQCYSHVHAECYMGLKYTVVNNNASFFRQGCIGCIERLKNYLILTYGKDNCIFQLDFF